MLTLCSPMLALEMLSPIAVTETTKVGTGSRRGGDGVGRARSAAGGARLYNLRLPPKASGKDTDLGRCPAPGFKGYAHAADPAPQERLVSKVAGWGSRESGMSQYKM